MPWTTPETFTAGQTLTAASMNAISGNDAALYALLANVQSTTLSTTTNTTITTGGTYYDVSGLSVAITPTANTSKVLLLANISVTCATTDAIIAVRLVRDSTAIGIGAAGGSRTRATVGAYLNTAVMTSTNTQFTIPMHFVDTPATASAITYKLQVTTNTNGSTVYVNRSQGDADAVGQFRATSTITAIEVPV